MFKSAIVERALLNWETMVGTSDIGIGFPEMYLLDDMDKKYKFIQKRKVLSPMHQILRLLPLYFTHKKTTGVQ